MTAWCSGRGGSRVRGCRGFESHWPRIHEIYAKNDGDGWTLAGGDLHRLKFFSIFLGQNFLFFGFFRFQLHSVKALPSVRQKTLGKDAFADPFFAEWSLPSANWALPSAPDTRQSH